MNVHKTFKRTSSERLIYVQFTSYVQRVSKAQTSNINFPTFSRYFLLKGCLLWNNSRPSRSSQILHGNCIRSLFWIFKNFSKEISAVKWILSTFRKKISNSINKAKPIPDEESEHVLQKYMSKTFLIKTKIR